MARKLVQRDFSDAAQTFYERKGDFQVIVEMPNRMLN
jgi:hypothetical protein